MNTKQFFSRWYHGMKNLSARRQLEASIAFDWGNLIGFGGGFITMIVWMYAVGDYKLWWTPLILIIAFSATCLGLINKYQQKRAMNDFDEQIKNLEVAKL